MGFSPVMRRLRNLGAVGPIGSLNERQGQWIKTRINFNGAIINMIDNGANGAHGTEELYTFPTGQILIASLILNVSFTAGVGGIDDDARTVVGVGSGPIGTTNDVMGATEDDFINNAGVVTLSSGAGSSLIGGPLVSKNNLAGGLKANLNFIVKEADVNADDTFTLTGKFEMLWSVLVP